MKRRAFLVVFVPLFDAAALAAEPARPVPLKAGTEFQGADVQALEKDDFANPGMLWVSNGEALWSKPHGDAAAACAGCHGDAELLGLTAYIARQSQGLPLAVSIDGEARGAFDSGRRMYAARMGQLNLACSHCHDANWGRTLLGEKVSQGHPAGWPAYRLEWQSMGSLQRRLRACFFGIRAEMPPYGSPDIVALELYLAWRAQGLAISTPGVRR